VGTFLTHDVRSQAGHVHSSKIYDTCIGCIPDAVPGLPFSMSLRWSPGYGCKRAQIASSPRTRRPAVGCQALWRQRAPLTSSVFASISVTDSPQAWPRSY